MSKLLVSCILVVVAASEVGAAEYICKLPGGKTSIQGSPCTNEAKTTYQNTRPYESNDEAQARIRDADVRINEPRRRELAEREAARAEARRQQQDEDTAKAKLAREQALLDETRRARQAAEDARAAAAQAAANSQNQNSRGMNCFQYGAFMDCKPR